MLSKRKCSSAFGRFSCLCSVFAACNCFGVNLNPGASTWAPSIRIVNTSRKFVGLRICLDVLELEYSSITFLLLDSFRYNFELFSSTACVIRNA